MSKPPTDYNTIVLILVLVISLTIIISPNINTASSISSSSQLIFGCMKTGTVVRCDPLTNKFSSATATSHTQYISTTNSTLVKQVEGVFGNGLPIYGYRQQYLTIPNQLEISPSVFSVALWLKQDPSYLANSSVISHVNSAKTAGWYLESVRVNSQSHVQFSVTNSDGKIFTVTSPIAPGIFQNVIAKFDGKSVKLYLDGFLLDNTPFVGDYDPNPNLPLNIGLNSYDYGRPWNGIIDELRLYNRIISDNEIQILTDYGQYLQSSRSSKDDGLIGYWSFDEGAEDRSRNNNDGKIILPAVSMIFSPDGRLFVSVRDAGEIRIMNPDITSQEELFVRLRNPSTNATQEILGITLDPDFATNHFVYAYVTAMDITTGNNFSMVVRFTESENKATEQKLLIDNIPAAGKGRPFGGALAFGPDDKLYVATGYTNQFGQGQNASLPGKVLRINRDGTIPSDNPFPNSPVYTLGHRNIFGISFDKGTGKAIIAENDAAHHDEINMLEMGVDYGYPNIQYQQSSAGSKLIQTDNSSGIKPARIYYKTITPTQMILYESNRFRELKSMFLVTSYSERSIYAFSINETGSIVEEIAIRLPEVRGHIVSIANSPNGDIYLSGESMYKLVSIDNVQPTLTYFIDIISNGDNNIQINGLSLNLSTKVLSIDVSNTTANVKTGPENTSATFPSLRVTVPKTLLGSISEVTTQTYNKTSDAADKVVESFKTKETRRITNAGDTIVDIQLNGNVTDDKILIKGHSSTLAPSPPRPIQIQR